MMSLKRQETNSTADGTQTQTTPFARQILLQPNDEVPNQDVELGSVYEIYHKNLPPRTPAQLRSTRVVMVSEKTDMNVAIRYPSIGSLRTYFSNRIREMYPALDEKFVMGKKLAGKVLFRQVPSQEFAENKHSEEFWLVNPNIHGGLGHHLGVKKEDNGLATELKNNGMVRWGVRRQVMFIGKHREMSKTQSSSSFVQGEEEVKNQQEVSKDEDDDDEEEEEGVKDEDEVEDEEEETHETSLKRKRESKRNLRKRKQIKLENQLWQVNKKPKKKCKKLIPRDPTDRWSKERYMAAERSLLEVMKEKKAMIGNPIIRPALRVEARKRIGDTGLLDHLLKHVANKVAPGGTLRFRRWHNADGAMEYWLENADLLKIRKDAGVIDPFWTPPAGWKPGDSPIQDPVMAKELNQLKEEISKIKGGTEECVSKKQFEEEIATLRREIEELKTKNNEDKGQCNMVSVPGDTSLKQLNLSDFLFSSESDLDNPNFPKEKYKEQMLAISDLLKKIQEWMQGEGCKGATKTITGTELIGTAEASAEKESEKRKGAEKMKGGGGVEGKAEKIERLKSGFRLCKPQGSFLWPNMVKADNNNMLSSQAVVPTPPSVNSSTAHHHHHHHLNPASPVKPVPERRPVTLTVSTLSEDNYSSTTTNLVNLNDIPTKQLHANPSSLHSPTTTTTLIPTPSEVKSETKMSGSSEDPLEANKSSFVLGSSSSASSGAPPPPWLVLAGPASTVDARSTHS